MEINLTKDALKYEATLFKEYKERTKCGASKRAAKEFEDAEIHRIFGKDNSEDIDDTIFELKQAGLISLDILGNVTLNDNLIIHMENKLKDSAIDIVSFLAQFIP